MFLSSQSFEVIKELQALGLLLSYRRMSEELTSGQTAEASANAILHTNKHMINGELYHLYSDNQSDTCINIF